MHCVSFAVHTLLIQVPLQVAQIDLFLFTKPLNKYAKSDYRLMLINFHVYCFRGVMIVNISVKYSVINVNFRIHYGELIGVIQISYKAEAILHSFQRTP